MQPIRIYTTRICPYCDRAKQLLRRKGLNYEEIRVDEHPDAREEMMRRSGRRSVPQIWIGETHVGGSDDLYELERRGELDSIVNR